MKSLALIASMILTSQIAMAACKDDIPANAPNERYILIADNVVKDKQTNLMWTQCSDGQTWDSGNCLRKPAKLTYHSAINNAQKAKDGNYSDWRLPTITELMTLVEYACHNPSINTAAFPKTDLGQYWSISKAAFDNTRSGNNNQIWRIDFGNGNTLAMLQTVTAAARYVRTAAENEQ